MAEGPLVCPSCSKYYGVDERFCPRCKMPLVYASAGGTPKPITERQERARKIKPQYSEGEPVRVGFARNQAEAEFIQGMLLEEGVPSMLRRSAGFDVPDFLAAGPRDILVPQSGAAAAREVLLEADLVSADGAARAAAAIPAPARLFAFLLLAIAVVAVVLFTATNIWG